MKLKDIKIGKLKVYPLLLAPMVEVTDLPYRILCKKYGAGLAYTEMLNIGSILHENGKTTKLMKTSASEGIVGIQITGRNEEEFRKVIPYLKNFDLVDINCGCPSIRITGNESGSYLLRNPEKIAGFVKILKSAGLTVTVKIRLGFKKNNVLEVAKAAEEAGADAITVHARLANQGGSVPADWKWIKKVKENVRIPVIANGDIFSGEDVVKVMKETGCDGVMIARAAIGNPLVFKEIKDYLRTGKKKEVDPKKKLKVFLDYLVLAKKHKVLELGRVKYLGARFLRDFEGAAKARDEFMKLNSNEEIKEFIKELIKRKL